MLSAISKDMLPKQNNIVAARNKNSGLSEYKLL